MVFSFIFVPAGDRRHGSPDPYLAGSLRGIPSGAHPRIQRHRAVVFFVEPWAFPRRALGRPCARGCRQGSKGWIPGKCAYDEGRSPLTAAALTTKTCRHEKRSRAAIFQVEGLPLPRAVKPWPGLRSRDCGVTQPGCAGWHKPRSGSRPPTGWSSQRGVLAGTDGWPQQRLPNVTVTR
jgi:hypothetical protein